MKFRFVFNVRNNETQHLEYSENFEKIIKQLIFHTDFISFFEKKNQ